MEDRADVCVGVATLLQLLRQVPLDKLNETVKRLKKPVPPNDLRRARQELIGRAPLAQFHMLKDV